MEPVNDNQYNQRINQWTNATRSRLKQSIGRLSSKGKGALVRSLVSSTKKDFGQIESIVFNFNRYGVFFHKGVGKGYTMSGGRVIRGYKMDSKITRIKKDLPKSTRATFAQGGSWFNTLSPRKSTPREPKEWFNPILDREVPRLADLVAEMRADMALDAAVIKIK